MRWVDVEARQPRLAAIGRQKLVDPGVVLVGTVRKDGTARISAVEPFLWRGELWLPMLLDSLKARDLASRPACPRPQRRSRAARARSTASSCCAAGRSWRTTRGSSDEIAAAIAEELPGDRSVGKFDLFRIDIEHVASIRWGDHNDQYLDALAPGTRAAPPRNLVPRASAIPSPGPSSSTRPRAASRASPGRGRAAGARARRPAGA